MFEPLQDEFMRRAIVEVTLIGIAGGALGCWVVLYRLSYAAESLAHSIFPGLVLATLAGVPLIVGGIPGIVVAALAIAAASRIPGVTREVAIGVVVTTLFGLGVLLALSPDSPPGLQEILFGDILGPTDADLGGGGCLGRGGRHRPAAAARAAAGGGLRPRRRALARAPRRGAPKPPCSSCSRVAIVVAVQGLGNLLVVAVFVGPAAAARQLTERIAPMIALAVAIAVLAGIAGLYLSYYAGTAGGASVALAIVAAYLLSLPLGAAQLTPARRKASPGGGYDRLDANRDRHHLGRARAGDAGRGGLPPRRRAHRRRRGARPPRLRGHRPGRWRRSCAGARSTSAAPASIGRSTLLEELGLVQRFEVERGNREL